jgi:hypothetical protein
VPPQSVDQPHALADELAAVVVEHPDLVCLLVEERDWQRVDALSERGPGDRGRVDRVGLPRLACRPPRGLGQARRDADHAIAAGEQLALQAS